MEDMLGYQKLTLPMGEIKGCVKKTIYDTHYYSFEGIPYAEPPIGELRFKSPLPAKPWSGAKDCCQFKIKPVQRHIVSGIIGGTEDCLYLNVFTKKLISEEPLPVMVWIYGGAFHMGKATRSIYGPDYLMEENVVVVTLNCRVHAFGFLSVEDPELEIPGNAGLKDQILAMKWVKQYIEHFNGDPENITLFGCSSGSVATHYLTATKQTEGLFHKAICMSGTMLNFWACNPPKDRAYRLAVEHGYQEENNDRKVVEFLRTLDAHKLVETDIRSEEDQQNGVMFTFCPCIEPYELEDCVIPEEPREMLKTAWGNAIPLIIGGCSDEGLFFYPQYKMFPEIMMKPINSNVDEILIPEMRDEDKDITADKVRILISAHFGDKEPTEECLNEFMELYGFKAFWHGFHRTLLSRLAYAKAPTYFYRFAVNSPTFNHYRTFFCGTDLDSGVAHADDMSYLWHGYMSWKLNEDSLEYKTIKRLVDIFTTFAKTSNPNCDQTSDVQWFPLADNEPDMALNIAEDLEYKLIPEKEKLLIWDSLYDENKLY